MLEETIQTPIKKNNLGLPRELQNITDGIEVTHYPSYVYAERKKGDTVNYYWFYKTTVKPVYDDLEITEFGSYIWYLDHWEFSTVTGKPFEPKDFAEWYKCQKSKMKKGKQYTDEYNWNSASMLQGGEILWYYIGKNKDGKLFKGVGVVSYLPELKQ